MSTWTRAALEFMSDELDGPIAIIAHEPLRLSPEAYREKLDVRY